MGPAVGLDTTAFGSMMCATTLQHCRLAFASVVVAYATIQPRAACAACDIQTVCEVKTDSTLLCCKVGFGQLEVQTGMQLQVAEKTAAGSCCLCVNLHVSVTYVRLLLLLIMCKLKAG